MVEEALLERSRDISVVGSGVSVIADLSKDGVKRGSTLG